VGQAKEKGVGCLWGYVFLDFGFCVAESLAAN